MPGAVGEQLLQTLLALDAADHSPSGFPITRLFLRQQRTWRLFGRLNARRFQGLDRPVRVHPVDAGDLAQWLFAVTVSPVPAASFSVVRRAVGSGRIITVRPGSFSIFPERVVVRASGPVPVRQPCLAINPARR
jgi:hypothetical protein